MPQATKSDTSVSLANQLVALAAQGQAYHDACVQFAAKNTAISPDTYWRQMATAAVNADGSLGAADATPVLSHPITVGGLNRAEADLLPGVTFVLEQIQFIEGTLPTNRAAVDRRAVLATLIG